MAMRPRRFRLIRFAQASLLLAATVAVGVRVAPAADSNGLIVTAPQATPSPPAQTFTLPPVVVSATRVDRSVADSTADATVVTQDQIQNSAAATLDDVLRPVPGFNTFRRSSSMVTAPAEDPEAQGVTLRGIGPGGASRALVMLDGIPINDAFGGWLYWGEIPLDGVERIEVVNGGGSNLWGSGAEGGVINIITQQPDVSSLSARVSYGTRNTTDDALTANYVNGPIRISFEGNIFDTGGWNLIVPQDRGPIDGNTSSFHQLYAGRIEYDLNPNLTFFLRGSYYHELLDLGTPYRSAGANRGFINGGGTWHAANGDQVSAQAYAHLSTYTQNYSLVNTPRTNETPSQNQRVPSTDVGGSLTWTHSLLEYNQLVAGGDFRLIDGKSEGAFFNSAGTAIDDRKVSSGSENFFGVFVEDIFRPTNNLEADLSVREDIFQNLDGRIRDSPTAAAATTTGFPSRMRTATSPKLGLRYAPRRWLTLRAGLYQAFRAPTLAELYRQSSVESLVLEPNPKLSPEFLEGGEIGADFSKIPGVDLSLTGYWDILHKPISNIVTAVNPVTGADAQRTRENLGKAQIRGYEVKFDYDTYWIDWHRWAQYDPDLHLTVDYLRSEASLVYNPPDPTLEGRRLTLVPWNTGSGTLSYHDDLLGEIGFEVQYQGMQWEDSDNHDRQPAYWLANVTLSRRLPGISVAEWLKNCTAYVKIQNLLDHEYIVDNGGGIPKIGTPFLLEAGLIIPANLR